MSTTGDGGVAVRLFGALEVACGDTVLGPRDLGGTRPKQVLEILLAARGHLVPTERIAEHLWGDDRPADVLGSVQTFVSSLRRRLTPDRDLARRLVVTEPEAYRFATDLVDLDLDRFDTLLQASAHEPTRQARRSLEAALALARGEVLEDEPYALWAQDLRGSYQGRVLGARLDAANAALAEHDFAAALVHADTAAALDRFSERAHRLAMIALYALERQHEALERYRLYHRSLDDELGLEPTPQTRAVEAAILQQADARTLLPRLVTAAPQPRSAPGTVVPLLGRGELLASLTETIAAADGVTVVRVEGDGGLGKSRLLAELRAAPHGARAGLAAGSELDRHLPYVPLAAAVREALAGVDLAADAPAALAHVLPELGLDGPAGRLDELAALEGLVGVLARHGRIAVLLDDLHLADDRTVAALRYLQRRGAELRLTVVYTVKPAELPLDAPLRRLEPDLTAQLEPLTAADLEPLGIPELHAATGGNPRFVAEALAAGSVVRPSRTLAEALLAHTRAQGEWPFRVLTAAAILPQPFAPETVAELLGADEATLAEELERLSERRILRVDGVRFRFRYDLVRRVLIGGMSPARRQLLGRRLYPQEERDSRPSGPAVGSAR